MLRGELSGSGEEVKGLSMIEESTGKAGTTSALASCYCSGAVMLDSGHERYGQRGL